MKAKVYALTAIILLTGMYISQKAHATIHQISVGDFSFNPSSLNVVVGDTIKWVWVSGTHTTTSTTIPVAATSWDQQITSTSTVYLYKVTIAGAYHYQCTYHAAMGMVGSFTATNALGVNNLSVSTYSIYPVPAKSKLNISAESLKTSAEEINIYNINSMRVLGPLTIAGSPASVDISTLPDGVYFIRIGNNKSATVQRIIKSQ